MLCKRHQKGPVYCDDDLAWTDFPVMNMHPHTWQLYSIAKLLGFEFTPEGVELAPSIPLKSYRFDSTLIGLAKLGDRYEGWYAPFSRKGRWVITLRLPETEVRRFRVPDRGSVNPSPLGDGSVLDLY